MSFLVAMLLLNMDTYATFSALCNLICQSHLYYFFKMDMYEIQRIVFVVDSLMKEVLPTLQKHIQKEAIDMNMLLVDWLMTLFSKNFTLDITARIWDIYFLEGEVTLYKIILGKLVNFL